MDKYFLWQTLREGDRRIKNLAAWRWVERDGRSAVTDSVREGYDPIPGRARMSVLVQIGDELNGHEGIVHGGFSAALLDDLIGWTTMAETEVQQLPGAPLTASLNLKYLRPVFSDRTYVVNMRAESVQRRQRPGPPSWAVTLHGEICDAEGNACVRAEALYVVKTFTAASLEKVAKGG
jgi:acyl-coenzyme A thioesterase PaaI-like protein|mmetsp:Transcript_77544/g.232527  ORF Transcript_77544/g.232527 Transcript_77544/m.232527 type:complete len:178 (-) Transcript_77544:414-947(-)|eukprot:7379536-Prymnesium_polylepis.2